MDRTKLNIGAFILHPCARSERHVKEVAECGLDFVFCCDYDRDLFDLFKKYGVGAIVSGVVPGWCGNGDNAGKMEETNPLAKYEKAARTFTDHPAIWGIDAGDEPSVLDFGHYGKVYTIMEKLFPHQFAYINLYPNYASINQYLNCASTAKDTYATSEQVLFQLGTSTYQEHIEKYAETVPTDYIGYAHYMYSTQNPSLAYENLRIVAGVCRASKRSMWVVSQVNSICEEECISENQLRHQAFSAMAFGAEVIMWACYADGWWYNNVLDKNGEKTEQYDKLRKINGEIARMGVPYMNYKNLSTHFVGFENSEAFAKVGQQSVERLDAGAFSGICAENGESVIAGHMKKRSGSKGEALMLVDTEDPWDKNPTVYRILFRCESSNVKAYKNGGEIPVERTEDGEFSVEMTSCAGILVTAE